MDQLSVMFLQCDFREMLLIDEDFHGFLQRAYRPYNNHHIHLASMKAKKIVLAVHAEMIAFFLYSS